jgi:ribosomal protein S19
MSKRSSWKFSFIADELYLTRSQNKRQKLILTTKSRNSTILPFHVGSSIGIHNGILYTTVNVEKSMIGHKFGEFAFTKRPFRYGKK